MLLILVGRLVQFAIALASVKIMTTLLSPDDMGGVSLVGATISLFALILVNPVGMFINRRMHSWQRDGVIRPYLHAYAGYVAGVALLSSAAVLGWTATAGGPLQRYSWGAAALVGGSLLFGTLNQTLVPSLNMFGRARMFLVLTLSTLIAGLLLSVVSTRLWGPGAVQWLAGPVAAQLVLGVVAYFVFFDRERDARLLVAIPKDAVVRLLHFSWPVAFAVGAGWLHMQGYRFLIAERFGMAELGLFAAGYGLAASLLSALEQVLVTWFQPAFYRGINNGDEACRELAWPRYASMTMPLALFGACVVVATAPELASVMLGPRFIDSSLYIALGAAAEFTRIVFGVLTLLAHARMQTRALLWPTGLGALVTLLAVYFLVPVLGIVYAPAAVGLGGLVAAAGLRATLGREHAKLPWRDLALAAAGGLAMLLLAWCMRLVTRGAGGTGNVFLLAVVGLCSAVLFYSYIRLGGTAQRLAAAST